MLERIASAVRPEWGAITMKYVYGPVPSRRLGQSLGIDPIPFKTCNWNCVYCQLGRTSPPTNERRDYIPVDDILAEVESALRAHQPGEIDWLTFVGSGEPTLHASLGMLIRKVRALSSLPVAVITNGSLLHRADVREELLPADVILPTVCAGTEVLYRRINRPLAELGYEQFIDGLVTFRNQYTGRLWVEVMLLQGVNDAESDLQDLAVVLRRIRPDEVHLNSPNRPPCEPWVKPVDAAALQRAQRILGDVAHVVMPATGEFDLSGFTNVVDAIVAVITRHPVSENELLSALDRWQPGHVTEWLAELERSGRAQMIVRDGQRFWSCSAARYVDARSGQCHER